MPLINLNVNEAKEQETAPEDTYDLRVMSTELVRTKNDLRDLLKVTVGIESAEAFAPIWENFVIPSEDDIAEAEDGDQKKQQMVQLSTLRLARFCSLFSIDAGEQLDTEDVDGAVCEAFLTRVTRQAKGADDEYHDVPGEFVNEIRYPRLLTEE